MKTKDVAMEENAVVVILVILERRSAYYQEVKWLYI